MKLTDARRTSERSNGRHDRFAGESRGWCWFCGGRSHSSETRSSSSRCLGGCVSYALQIRPNSESDSGPRVFFPVGSVPKNPLLVTSERSLCCFQICSLSQFVTGIVLSVCVGEMLFPSSSSAKPRSPYSLGGNQRLGETYA